MKDVRKNIENNVYKNQLAYPKRKSKDEIVQKLEDEKFTGTIKEIQTELEKRIQQENEDYKKQFELYREENNRLYEKFKNDLFKEFDIEDHPKREKLWEIADYRHNTLQAVYETFNELSELIV